MIQTSPPAVNAISRPSSLKLTLFALVRVAGGAESDLSGSALVALCLRMEPDEIESRSIDEDGTASRDCGKQGGILFLRRQFLVLSRCEVVAPEREKFAFSMVSCVVESRTIRLPERGVGAGLAGDHLGELGLPGFEVLGQPDLRGSRPTISSPVEIPAFASEEKFLSIRRKRSGPESVFGVEEQNFCIPMLERNSVEAIGAPGSEISLTSDED
jgi:hypothetical protein